MFAESERERQIGRDREVGERERESERERWGRKRGGREIEREGDSRPCDSNP